MSNTSGAQTISPCTAGTLRTDTLVDSVLILLVMAGVQRLIGFGRAVLFCRWLDADQLGQWDMVFGFLTMAAPVVILALPGAFGRYVEHYLQKGQLQAFLRRIIVVCAALAIGAFASIWLARAWFSHLIFGTADHGDLVVLAAAGLMSLIGFNFLIELFTALRNIRLVSMLQLLHSASFATAGAGLLLFWHSAAHSVVLAYGAACMVAALVAAWHLRQSWGAIPASADRLRHRALWPKLMPFAVSIWMTNLLVNLFAIVDRYMIVHFSTMEANEAMATVGQYHSSLIIPLLFVSIAGMIAAMVTPHLSSDWEAGRRDRVASRLTLLVKLTCFALTAASVAVTFAAPLLFDVAFGGKYSAGLLVLPWTLTYCTWFGTCFVLQNYLYCAEKAYLSSLAFLAGLIVNVSLNLVLLPRLGLLGAVLATTIANLAALLAVVAFSRMLGFRIDRGTWIVLALPPTVCLGPWVALMALVAVAVDTVYHERILSADQKSELVRGWLQYRDRLGSLGASLRSVESSR